jgi:hypothetical protein
MKLGVIEEQSKEVGSVDWWFPQAHPLITDVLMPASAASFLCSWSDC